METSRIASCGVQKSYDKGSVSRVRMKTEALSSYHDDFLVHYGVKGQKWGITTKQYQPVAVDHRLRANRSSNAMSSRSPYSVQKRSSSNRQSNASSTSDAKRSRAKKIIGIAAGVAVAAALGYAAYKGSTNLRDSYRNQIKENFNTDFSKNNGMYSKYWNSDDRNKYTDLSTKWRDYQIKDFTRRDAIASKFAEKTGIKLSLPESRERTLNRRHAENEFSNFVRGCR